MSQTPGTYLLLLRLRLLLLRLRLLLLRLRLEQIRLGGLRPRLLEQIWLGGLLLEQIRLGGLLLLEQVGLGYLIRLLLQLHRLLLLGGRRHVVVQGQDGRLCVFGFRGCIYRLSYITANTTATTTTTMKLTVGKHGT